MYSQLIFDQGAKSTQWGKDSLFNKWCWENWIIICKRTKLDPYFTPLTKIKSKWIKGLNVRPETIKLLGKNIGEISLTWVLVMIFFNMTPKTQATETKINKWDYIKLKSFCTAKEAINKVKRQPMEWEKICANIYPSYIQRTHTTQ